MNGRMNGRARGDWAVAGKPALALALLLAACAALAGCARSAGYKITDVAGLVAPLELSMTNDEGQPVTAASFRDEVVLLYFGYTHCGDACPTTLATLANALRALGPSAARVRVLFVTVDPRRDTGAVLKRYVSNFGPEFVGLRGDSSQLTALIKRYRVAYHYEKPDRYGDYEVDHSSAVFIFGPSGRARLLAQLGATSQAISADLRQLLVSG
jgi:protein SCO1/2